MIGSNNTIGAYNEHAVQFDLESWQRGTDIRAVELLDKLGKTKPNVVELGCGSGREAKSILTKYPEANYLGMDGSEQLIQIAKKKVPQAKFEVATFSDFQIPNNLDAIFAFASLLHADRETMRKVLHQSAQKLNTDGVFFMTLQYGDYNELIKHDELGERTFYLYTPEEIMRLLPKDIFDRESQTYELRSRKWFDTTLWKK